jgi:hypothetical protein
LLGFSLNLLGIASPSALPCSPSTRMLSEAPKRFSGCKKISGESAQGSQASLIQRGT